MLCIGQRIRVCLQSYVIDIELMNNLLDGVQSSITLDDFVGDADARINNRSENSITVVPSKFWYVCMIVVLQSLVILHS